jgi:hypothetical protein
MRKEGTIPDSVRPISSAVPAMGWQAADSCSSLASQPLPWARCERSAGWSLPRKEAVKASFRKGLPSRRIKKNQA